MTWQATTMTIQSRHPDGIDMTGDVTLATFLSILRKSQLLDSHVLDRAEGSFSGTARELAEQLVGAGELTHFQAGKLLHGHWRGLRIGPYRILAPLGRGGMGTVYLGQDTRLAAELGDEVLVALKVLPPKVAQAERRMLERFERELELGRRTAHPNVTRTLAGGEQEGVHFIAMEYVPGQTVRQLVEEHGPMDVGEVARIFADVAAGLGHLHQRGMIHRDLKPANVMVTPSGKAKILDLGLALVPFDPRPFDRTVVGGKGYIVGTMDYISPEQALNPTEVTPRSDFYALGCSMYYALTGTPPFPGGTSRDKIRAQRMLEPAALLELNSAIDREFARVVESLMSKDPAGRPATAPLVRDMLMPWAGSKKATVVMSLHQAVEAVDRPEAHPDLWTEESESEQLEEEQPAANEPQWLFIAAVAGGLLLLTLILMALRRL